MRASAPRSRAGGRPPAPLVLGAVPPTCGGAALRRAPRVLAGPGTSGPREPGPDRRTCGWEPRARAETAAVKRLDPVDVAVAPLRLHPLAARVPEMRPAEWRAFLEDIRQRGIREPLRLAPDCVTVLDGRHRLRAARELGLESVHAGPGSPGPDRTAVGSAADMAVLCGCGRLPLHHGRRARHPSSDPVSAPQTARWPRSARRPHLASLCGGGAPAPAGREWSEGTDPSSGCRGGHTPGGQEGRL